MVEVVLECGGIRGGRGGGSGSGIDNHRDGRRVGAKKGEIYRYKDGVNGSGEGGGGGVVDVEGDNGAVELAEGDGPSTCVILGGVSIRGGHLVYGGPDP